MNGFCVERISPPGNLRASRGVLRSSALAVTAEAGLAAEQILQRARDEAAALVAEAQRCADRLTADAEARALRREQEALQKASALTRDTERATLESADRLLKGLEEANAVFLARSGDMVVTLTQGLFDRLVRASTPRTRLEAMLAQLIQEAPSRLAEAMLHVHPDDVALLPALEWEIKPDASLARGTCRLEAASGEWRASFDAAVEALTLAFAELTTEPGSGTDHRE